MSRPIEFTLTVSDNPKAPYMHLIPVSDEVTCLSYPVLKGLQKKLPNPAKSVWFHIRAINHRRPSLPSLCYGVRFSNALIQSSDGFVGHATGMSYDLMSNDEEVSPELIEDIVKVITEKLSE